MFKKLNKIRSGSSSWTNSARRDALGTISNLSSGSKWDTAYLLDSFHVFVKALWNGEMKGWFFHLCDCREVPVREPLNRTFGFCSWGKHHQIWNQSFSFRPVFYFYFFLMLFFHNNSTVGSPHLMGWASTAELSQPDRHCPEAVGPNKAVFRHPTSKQAWESPELLSAPYQTARTNFRPANVESQKKGRNPLWQPLSRAPWQRARRNRACGTLQTHSITPAPKRPEIQPQLRKSP